MKKHDWATGAGAAQRKLLQCTAVLCLTLGSAIAYAQNAIQSLSGVAQGGGEVVRIEMTEPLLAVPSGFTIQSPARIALDFPGVVNGIGRSAVEINQGNLRSANVVQAGDRTRVVINLKQAASYQARMEGKTLLIVLDRTEASATAAGAPASSPFLLKAATAALHRSKMLISGEEPARRAKWSSSWRTTRSAWTSASRGRTWWWIS